MIKCYIKSLTLYFHIKGSSVVKGSPRSRRTGGGKGKKGLVVDAGLKDIAFTGIFCDPLYQFSLIVNFNGSKEVCLWRLQCPEHEVDLKDVKSILSDSSIASLFLKSKVVGELAYLKLICFPGSKISLVETPIEDYAKAKNVKVIYGLKPSKKS